MNEIVKRYLTIDQKHIKRIKQTDEITSIDIFYQILKSWKIISSEKTIGYCSPNGNVPQIRISLDGNKYVVNADSTKDGVTEFLKNKNNPWYLIENKKGIKNKITNTENKSSIKGFYMYKV
jgi:hypothetical protein